MLDLADLGIVLAVLAVLGLVARKAGLSGIPLYIVAGIILGPNEPSQLSIVEISEGTELLSRLGVVLLLFYLGLEFSLERLTQARRLLATGGGIDLVVNAGAGLAIGLLLFGPGAEAILMTGVVYVSSSGIVTQALFDLGRLGDDETDLVLGILVFEDFAIALFLGIAAAVASGAAVGAGATLLTALVAVGFVLIFLVLSRYAHVVVDRIAPRIGREQLLLGVLAVAIGAAGLAEIVGLSEAIGALLAGVLLSASDIRETIERQLIGLRDFAAAIFFFSFGLAIDLTALDEIWLWLLAAIPIGVAGKLVSGYLAGRAARFSPAQSVNVSAALVPRGEFSVILAQLAAAGVALETEFRDRIVSFTGLLVVTTAALGVLFMRESRTVGRWLRRRQERRRGPTASEGVTR